MMEVGEGGAELAGNVEPQKWWTSGRQCPRGHAATGGEVTDGSGRPWWWRRLAGVNAVAPCDGNGPRGPKPINYLRDRVCR